MSLPSEPERGEPTPTRVYTVVAVALLIVVGIATAASWRLFPVFIDTYYHMAVIEGFAQAGGITTRAFWEMAPGGRVHIYPPALHLIGYFFYLLGVSPGTYMTFVSGTVYAGCLLTTWLWLRQVIGPRSALFGLILLCGPYAFFWSQATFQAVGGVMVLAPLALLALEKERFLACGVLNFIVITMHPFGLFLPPALVINALLRRKKILAGLLAASAPVALYGPWLAHIWANRAFLPDSRTGSEISLGNPGQGANLGLFLVPAAALAIPWLVARRGPALGLVGALLGFAVVFPMGFGGRFLSYNIHWPLACLGGYGLGELARWLESRPALRVAGSVASITVACAALLAYPAINFPLGGPGPGGWPGGPGGSGTTNMRERLTRILSEWRFTLQGTAVPKLFDSYTGGGFGMGPGGPGFGGPGMGFGPPGMGFGPPGMGFGPPGMGPGGPPGMGPGGPGMGPGGMPGMGPGGPSVAGGGPGIGPGGPWPGFGFGGPGAWASAPRPGAGLGGPGTATGPGTQPQPPGANPTPGPGAQSPPGRQAGRGARADRGMGMFGMNLLTRAGAQEFFDAVRENVEPGSVIHMNDGPAANLIAGATGRWTSSGILRDVRSESGRVRPEDCDFAVVLGGGMGMPGLGGPMGFQTIPSKFETVFENDYGTLYRNPVKVEHAREPLRPAVGLPLLAVTAVVGFLLVLVDFLPLRRPRIRLAAAAAGTIVVALCLVPLASVALGELRNPPSAPPASADGPFGFGPPGFGPPGFGGPGFGVPGFADPAAGAPDAGSGKSQGAASPGKTETGKKAGAPKSASARE